MESTLPFFLHLSAGGPWGKSPSPPLTSLEGSLEGIASVVQMDTATIKPMVTLWVTLLAMFAGAWRSEHTLASVFLRARGPALESFRGQCI